LSGACSLGAIGFGAAGGGVALAPLLLLPLLSQGTRLHAISLELQSSATLHALKRLTHLVSTVDIAGFEIGPLGEVGKGLWLAAHSLIGKRSEVIGTRVVRTALYCGREISMRGEKVAGKILMHAAAIELASHNVVGASCVCDTRSRDQRQHDRHLPDHSRNSPERCFLSPHGTPRLGHRHATDHPNPLNPGIQAIRHVVRQNCIRRDWHATITRIIVITGSVVRSN
jgi:hypothetical protein